MEIQERIKKEIRTYESWIRGTQLALDNKEPSGWEIGIFQNNLCVYKIWIERLNKQLESYE